MLRAYNDAEEIVDGAMVGPADAAATLAKFFAEENVAFVHARFPVYGCFACRVDRA